MGFDARKDRYIGNIPFKHPASEQYSDGKTARAEKIFDHDLKFLTYEGSVNKGKGTVKIADNGFYKILCQTENEIHLCFNGEILRAGFCLKFVKDNLWQLEYENI